MRGRRGGEGRDGPASSGTPAPPGRVSAGSREVKELNAFNCDQRVCTRNRSAGLYGSNRPDAGAGPRRGVPRAESSRPAGGGEGTPGRPRPGGALGSTHSSVVCSEAPSWAGAAGHGERSPRLPLRWVLCPIPSWCSPSHGTMPHGVPSHLVRGGTRLLTLWRACVEVWGVWCPCSSDTGSALAQQVV